MLRCIAVVVWNATEECRSCTPEETAASVFLGFKLIPAATQVLENTFIFIGVCKSFCFKAVFCWLSSRVKEEAARRSSVIVLGHI